MLMGVERMKCMQQEESYVNEVRREEKGEAGDHLQIWHLSGLYGRGVFRYLTIRIQFFADSRDHELSSRWDMDSQGCQRQ